MKETAKGKTLPEKDEVITDWTPLHEAALKNAPKAVRALLENGADVNAKTPGGSTPLHV